MPCTADITAPIIISTLALVDANHQQIEHLPPYEMTKAVSGIDRFGASKSIKQRSQKSKGSNKSPFV